MTVSILIFDGFNDMVIPKPSLRTVRFIINLRLHCKENLKPKLKFQHLVCVDNVSYKSYINWLTRKSNCDNYIIIMST